MRTTVIQRRTGTILGYCDVQHHGGRAYYVGVALGHRHFTRVRFRWKWTRQFPTVSIGEGWGAEWQQDKGSGERYFYLIAYGLRDASLLKGFNSLDELFLHHTLGSLPARGNA